MAELMCDMPRIFDGVPFTRSDALAAGVDSATIQRLRRQGLIRTLVRGVYVDSAVEDSLPMRAAAIAKVAPADAVICRETAAWLYGVDVLAMSEKDQLRKVDFVRPPASRALRQPTANGHAQTLLVGDVVEQNGLQVTSPVATAVHLGRHLPRPFALTALDAMTRAELVTLSELREAVRRYPHHPGIVQARELADLADPRAESPGESWLRLRIIDAGFPRPVPQIVVPGNDQDYRVDLGFAEPLPGRDRRLALEYDSDQWHSTAAQRAADEVRARALGRRGWLVMSVGRGDVSGAKPELELAVGELLGIVPRLPRRW